MKLFYFGSVCADEVFNDTVKKSKVKPSDSAQNFENALIKGFLENNVELTVVSAESIATYPKGNRLILKERKDSLNTGCASDILPAINLPLFKQNGHTKGAKKRLIKWLKDNKDESEKCVLVYGIYPAVVKSLQKLCAQNRCKIFAVITDVPSTMFTYTQNKSVLKRLFSGSYRKAAIELQGKFDGYIYLTEAMSEEVAPGKPYTVVETIADTSIFDTVGTPEKSVPPAVMYAGALYKKYGVDLIVDSFEKVKSNCELWLFGSGDYEEEIKKKAQRNTRIRFFGRVPRQEVLQYEKKASLLLNIRSGKEVYTKYSFPSKMAEYLLSGTPLLTTKLPGIPEEYYDYCYVTATGDTGKIAERIDGILHDSNTAAFGYKAKEYVEKHKNSYAQAARIIRFLKEQIDGGIL